MLCLLSVHVILPILEDPIEILELFTGHLRHLEAFLDVDPGCVSVLAW